MWEFAKANPGTALLIVFVLALLIDSVACKVCSRTMRCLMVRKHGWPPAHLDADGDWKREKKH